MAKGALAKENVTKIIADAFGSNFIGEFDKKVYVMANDGGEMVQIAISLTCPKTPIVFNGTGGDLNFEDDAPSETNEKGPAVVTMSADEQATLDRLMKELDL